MIGPVVPVILAAGASQRMGQPKALLMFGGRTCLQIVADAFAAGGADAPVIVVAPDSPVGAHARQVAGARVVENPHPENGQTSSLQIGLGALPDQTAGFLAHPVDHPLVTSQIVRALIAAFAATPTADILIPSFEHRRGHPLLMRAGLADEIRTLPADGTTRTVVNRHTDHILYIDAPDADALMDMDTPADYQRCLTRFNARQGILP